MLFDFDSLQMMPSLQMHMQAALRTSILSQNAHVMYTLVSRSLLQGRLWDLGQDRKINPGLEPAQPHDIGFERPFGDGFQFRPAKDMSRTEVCDPQDRA